MPSLEELPRWKKLLQSNIQIGQNMLIQSQNNGPGIMGRDSIEMDPMPRQSQVNMAVDECNTQVEEDMAVEKWVTNLTQERSLKDTDAGKETSGWSSTNDKGKAKLNEPEIHPKRK